MTLQTESRRSNRLPHWLRRRIPTLAECSLVESTVKKHDLRTICREALCPNRAECYSKGKATFIILGDICTRGCRFCSVKKGAPSSPDEKEAESIALAVDELGLNHVIVTSVTRDDLPDGGSGHYAAVIRALKALDPPPTVEVLVPDFGGNQRAAKTVLQASPDIFSHNMETVRRLYPELRRGADYGRSLFLLTNAKQETEEVMTKSAVILGLGESRREIRVLFEDLRKADCDFLVIGQYLRPGMDQVPVSEYVQPDLFYTLEKEAYRLGFLHVTSGPLVRSSFQDIRIEDFRPGRSLTGGSSVARRSVP
jgi:lipoic acid synthetase